MELPPIPSDGGFSVDYAFSAVDGNGDFKKLCNLRDKPGLVFGAVLKLDGVVNLSKQLYWASIAHERVKVFPDIVKA